MTDETPIARDPDLFRQWRRHNRPAAASPADFMSLAAYLDGGLDAAEVERVEAALVDDPALLDLVLAPLDPPMIPSAGLIRRAQALKSRPGQNAARPMLAWMALAASLVLVSLAGFDLGMSAAQAANPSVAGEAPTDLIDIGDGIG